MVLEEALECLLDCKKIRPVHPKGDQPWDFFGRTDVEAETPILWPPHVKHSHSDPYNEILIVPSIYASSVL